MNNFVNRAERRAQLEIENSIKMIPIQNILQGIYRRATAMTKELSEQRKFDDLYSLLSNEALLIQAYGNISRNKGSLTPGVNTQTVDAMSLKKIQKLSQDLKSGLYKFSRLRRKWIPKVKLFKKGEIQKFRPLGVPTFNDRLVQEGIRIILEAIYEPLFHKYEMNMGFRPNRGCHHAISQLKYNGSGCTLALEGDIEGAYDNVNQEVMIKIMGKRISDHKFLKFLKLGMKCGLLDQGERIDTLTGVPQGGLASPLLFNIYMQEFDEYIENQLKIKIIQKNKQENRSYKPRNKEYDILQGRVTALRSKLKRYKGNKEKFIDLNEIEKEIVKKYQSELKELGKQRVKVPSLRQDLKATRIYYMRYADDFIVLTNGTKEFGDWLKEEIANWLQNNLKLKLSGSKTKVTNLKIEAATFLGFSLKTYIKRRFTKNKYGELQKRAGWDIIVDIDWKRILDRLQLKGFMNYKYKPIAKISWSVLEPQEIINRYNYIIRGLGNYYYPMVDRLSYLSFIFYVMKFSCIGTFAKKYKSKITKITEKYGDPLTIKIKEIQTFNKIKSNETEKSYTLLTYKKYVEANKHIKFDWKKKRNLRTPEEDVFKPMISINWRTRRNLTNVCAICGTDKNVEMHHVRHIKKGKVIGFTQVLNQLNRTMIPLCRTHHYEVHTGKYDSLKLSDLYGIDRFLL